MPVSLDATADVRAGVALVTARVSNPTPVARGVRLRNRLDGPVLPPRRHGAPVAGWSDEGFEGVVPGEGTLALGYACPVGGDAAAERPLELASVGAPAEATDDPPAERARRTLAPARPPRDVVPRPETDGEPNPRGGDERGGASADGAPPLDDTEASAVDSASSANGGSEPVAVPSPTTPDPVDAYLDAVERRVARGERLTDASVAEATAALSDADPEAAPVADLPDALAADADALDAFAERAQRLAERARATEVPVAALRRLA